MYTHVEKVHKSANMKGRVIWTKTRWTQKIPRCGSIALEHFFPKGTARQTIVGTVKSSVIYK